MQVKTLNPKPAASLDADVAVTMDGGGEEDSGDVLVLPNVTVEGPPDALVDNDEGDNAVGDTAHEGHAVVPGLVVVPGGHETDAVPADVPADDGHLDGHWCWWTCRRPCR